jgi:hypothetical protein
MEGLFVSQVANGILGMADKGMHVVRGDIYMAMLYLYSPIYIYIYKYICTLL